MRGRQPRGGRCTQALALRIAAPGSSEPVGRRDRRARRRRTRSTRSVGAVGRRGPAARSVRAGGQRSWWARADGAPADRQAESLSCCYMFQETVTTIKGIRKPVQIQFKTVALDNPEVGSCGALFIRARVRPYCTTIGASPAGSQPRGGPSMTRQLTRRTATPWGPVEKCAVFVDSPCLVFFL